MKKRGLGELCCTATERATGEIKIGQKREDKLTTNEKIG